MALLRILSLTWGYYPTPAGGAEKQARIQAEELARRGHSVTVVCPRDPSVAARYRLNGVRVRRLPRFDRRPFRRASYLVSLGLFLLVRARSFDVVHIHLANLQVELVVGLCHVLGRPTYVKVACGGPAGEVQRLASVARFSRWFGLRNATRVQALSEEIASELVSIGVNPKRIVRIPNGIEAPPETVDLSDKGAIRRRLGLPPDHILFLFAGRFARYKGVEDLIGAWASAPVSTPATLVLVGEPAVDQPAASIEPRANLLVRPWTPSIWEYLKAADVFVYPSYSDGMSNALLEAMSAGLPVVAARSGAIAELISHGAEGLLVDPGDQVALRRALDQLTEDPRLRIALGENAKERALGYDVGGVVDAVEQAYAGMVRGW